MSDWSGATIYIGGQLPAKDLPSFIKVLEDEVCSLKALQESSSPEEFMKILGESLNANDESPIIGEDQAIKLSVNEARYGRFEDLEELCVAQKLTFIRFSEAYSEYEAEVAWYQPGMEEVNVQYCNNQLEITCDLSRLNNMIHEIEGFNPEDAPTHINEGDNPYIEFLATWSLKNPWDKIKAFKAWLNVTYPEPPDSAGEFKIIPE